MSDSNVQWGKVITGAAIAAGAIAAFAFFAVPLEDSIVPALQEAIQGVGSAISATAGWISENVIGSVNVAAQDATSTYMVNSTTGVTKLVSETAAVEGRVGEGIVGFITAHTGLAAAAAAVAGGIYASGSRSRTSPQQADTKSFALDEQMGRAEALMKARMIATGYQPAMANAPSRR